MERPALSVLINNYNYARFVGRAIDSVLSQDARNVEIIVIGKGHQPADLVSSADNAPEHRLRGIGLEVGVPSTSVGCSR